jgi:hypothetical protein
VNDGFDVALTVKRSQDGVSFEEVFNTTQATDWIKFGFSAELNLSDLGPASLEGKTEEEIAEAEAK